MHVKKKKRLRLVVLKRKAYRLFKMIWVNPRT